MFPIFQIGPLSLPTSGIVYLIGFGLGLSLCEKWSARFEVEGSKLSDLILTAAITGFIGARLTVIASDPRFFFNDPLAAISLNPLLLDLTSGVVIAVFTAVILAYRKGIFAWKTLDAVTPLAAIGNISLGFSHLASGKAYGAVTEVPWGMYLWNAHRHPTQVYEICFAVFSFGIVWYAAHLPLKGNGQTFALFLMGASIGHLINGAFLAPNRLIVGGIRVEQIYAYLVLIFSLWLFGKTFPKEAGSHGIRE